MIRSPCLPTARRRRTKRIRTPDAAWSSRGSPQSAMLPVPSSIRLVSISAESRRAQSLNAPFGAQCFPTREEAQGAGLENLSQCTFWCLVLSDSSSRGPYASVCGSQCTFWCSVLSDMEGHCGGSCRGFGVSMHLLVLSAFRPPPERRLIDEHSESQCTFWCSVLSDAVRMSDGFSWRVSMHLLVLSAFRH